MKVDKILTDNPYVDEMVYYVKILAYDCVIKSEKLALAAETEESLRDSSLYLACVNNTATFELLTYPVDLLMECGLSEKLAIACQTNIQLIPVGLRGIVFEKGRVRFIKDYIEKNNYYRMLNGHPNYMTLGIKVTGWTVPDGVVIDLNKYIHEMSDLELEILDYYGVLDTIKEQHPTDEYLNHLGSKSIDYVISRQASNFQVLYLPNIESTEIYERFKERLDNNKNYVKKTIYSDAFAYGSEYYDNFMIVLIVITTMIDMFADIQEFIAKKEILNLRCIQYIFKSYGIPYYPEIPIKYQIAMVKNINTLLKYKSTSRNMVDICSLFGFDNVEVFKYYLLRERVMDDEGKYVYYYNEDGTEDTNKNYQLKFVRVPLNDEADDYIKDKSSYLSYDDVTIGDPMWDGSRDHNELKGAILDQEFNYARTKYVSIDNMYEVTQLAFQMPYFFNMIFDNIRTEELLTLQISYLSNDHKFKMTDAFAYLYSLTYAFYGTVDEIMNTDDLDRILYITGFNFSVDMAALGEYVAKRGFTLAELGVSEFNIPKSSVLSYNQLMEIFTKNGKIRDHVIKQLVNANDKKMYDIYLKLYNSLMITKFNNDYFRNPSTGKICATYTEYLGIRDSILFQSINDIKSITDEEQRIQTITTIINSVVSSLNQYIDTTSYKYIYSNLPSVSSESIKAYVVKVIDFFKSYKIDFLGMNTIYKFDDKLDNTVKIIDNLKIGYVFSKTELIKYFDHTHSTYNMTYSEKMSILEDIYFDISRWSKFTFTTDIGNSIRDIIYGTFIKLLKKDGFKIEEEILIKYNSIYNTHSNIIDLMYSMIVSIDYTDKSDINDYINLINTVMMKSTLCKIDEKISYKISLFYKELNSIEDMIASNIIDTYKKDKYDMKDIIRSLISVYNKMDYSIIRETMIANNYNGYIELIEVIEKFMYVSLFNLQDNVKVNDIHKFNSNIKMNTNSKCLDTMINKINLSCITNQYTNDIHTINSNTIKNDIFTFLDRMYYDIINSNGIGYVLNYNEKDTLDITTTDICSIKLIGFNTNAFTLKTPKLLINEVETEFNAFGTINNIQANSVIKITNTKIVPDTDFLICFRIDY